MKVLICGASVEGLTLAWGLVRQGHDVAVIESRANLGDEDYMMPLFGAGYDASEQLGLARIESIHDPADRMVILDAHGRERLSIPYPILRRRLFKNRHLSVMRSRLVEVLYDRVKGYGEVRFGATIASLDRGDESIRARFSDGTVVHAELLVGADGVHSLVRRLAFGTELKCRHFLGDYAIAFVSDDVPPRQLRQERAAATLTAPGRQVTVFPICGGRVATVCLHRAQGRVTDFSPAAARRELQAVYGDLAWFVPQLNGVAAASGVHFGAVEQIRLPRWSTSRVVLVGEACYGVAPLPGQGASLAIAGACVLAEALGHRYDTGAALARYERQLRPLVHHQQKAARRMSKWLVPSSAIGVSLRNVATGMSVWPAAASLMRQRFGAQSLLGM